ncbi:unnamed protein product, partial [Mesorhabditis belari]|uniref:MULE transposase domain-containing protein n=1 Tax=Mesorhabditis belari TaxID=2138241 RepID=A0AAF3J700_9BILA
MSLSQKGGVLLYDEDGHEYRKDKTIRKGVATAYRCTKTNCRGRMHKDEATGVLSVTNEHAMTCLPLKEKEEIRGIHCGAKNDRIAGVPTKEIIKRRVLGARPHLLPYLNAKGIQQMARRQVKIDGDRDWPAPVTGTFRVLFLRYDNCSNYPAPHANAIKFFATDWGIDMLLQHPIWSIDGTFYAAPFGDVFGLVKQLGLPPPTKIKTDMELAIVNGFMAVYGNTSTIHFCCFHFFKAIFRKIKEKKLQDIYCDSNMFVYVKGLLALTFIRPVDVLRYFRVLRDEAFKQIPSLINELQGLYSYFEKSFVGFVQNSRFIRPTHSIETWNSYDTICRGEQLGNSSQESYNSLLKALTSRCSARYVAQKLLDIQEDFEKTSSCGYISAHDSTSIFASIVESSSRPSCKKSCGSKWIVG